VAGGAGLVAGLSAISGDALAEALRQYGLLGVVGLIAVYALWCAGRWAGEWLDRVGLGIVQAFDGLRGDLAGLTSAIDRLTAWAQHHEAADARRIEELRADLRVQREALRRIADDCEIPTTVPTPIPDRGNGAAGAR
jgi:hypothetical protein